METRSDPRPGVFRLYVSLAIAILTAGTAVQIAQTAAGYNIHIFRTWHSGWPPLFAALFMIEAGALLFLAVARLPVGQQVVDRMDALAGLHPTWRIAGIAGLVATLPVFPLVVTQSFYARFLDGGWARITLFLLLSLIGMLFLKLGRQALSWPAALAWSALAQAVFYNSLILFAAVSSYPFSLTWSEISRYYGASLFLAGRIYGAGAPLPLLHPTYDLLLLPPFFLGTPPIWVLRLWQDLVQVGLTAALVFAFHTRLGTYRKNPAWIAAGWAYLFLMQGPIQSHLVLCALLAVWLAAPKNFWRTTIVVLLASVWAGVSRINWFPVPGLLAACCYFLETPFDSPGRWPAYLRKPAVWFLLGTATAFASNLLYARWAGNGALGNFGSSLNSDLLWYRLLPNPNYPLGILPAILLASIPVFLVLILALYKARPAFHPLRLACLCASLAVLFVGGLVVSVKIGGGEDLHNLDAYLILLLLLGGYLFTGRAAADRMPAAPAALNGIGLAALAIAVPIWFAIQSTPKFPNQDQARAERMVELIRLNAEKAAAQGEEVLFISERQLIALDGIKVSLVPDYEQDYLMEMVMSHNRSYLDRFQSDLRAQRYGMIVIFPQGTQYDGPDRPSREENNYWVDEVSKPLLCYYEAAILSHDLQVGFYVPRLQPCK
jgi:hypothetical protein